MRFQVGAFSGLYDEFIRDPASSIGRFQGDQDLITDYMVRNNIPVSIWPENQIKSFKRHFAKSQNIDAETRVIVFHGRPNPHELRDQTYQGKYRYSNTIVNKYWY